MNYDHQNDYDNRIFVPTYRQNHFQQLEHEGYSINQNQYLICQPQLEIEITYQIQDIKVREKIKLIVDIYQYFSEKMNKNESNIFVTVDKKVVRRGQNFYQMKNYISKDAAAFIIYDVENLLAQLEEAEKQIKKQQNLINQTLLSNSIAQEVNESVIQNYSSTFQQKMKKQKEEVENNFQSEMNSQMSSLQRLIQYKKNELEKLQTIHSSQIKSQYIGFQSILKSVQNTCCFCNFSIKAEMLQTPCQHNFHKDCFETMVQSQILDKKCKLICICANKIPLKCMKQFIENKFQADIYNQQFLTNQIVAIKESYPEKIRLCKTNCCPFFFVYIHQRIMNKQSFCPLCLI